MYQVDVISSYIVCGLGALLGSWTVTLGRSEILSVRKSLRITSLGFFVFGFGLVQFLFWPLNEFPSWAVFAAANATLIGLILFCIGFEHLMGEADSPFVPLNLWVLIGILGFTALTAAWWLGDLYISQVYALLGSLITGLLIFLQRELIQHPRNMAEKLLGGFFILVAVSFWIRLIFALTHQGPAPADLLHMPTPYRSIFAVLYAVMPLLLAQLVLTVCNYRLYSVVKQESMTDSLTGIFTRRAMDQALQNQRISNEKGQLALMLMDIDYFKKINDTFGHDTGDSVLREVARRLQLRTRQGSMLVRYGGEEFLLLTQVENQHSAQHTAERLRLSICETPMTAKGSLRVACTISIGLTLVRPDDALEAAVERADQALYTAKRSGRNQVISAEDDISGPAPAAV
jgi:diguanylate cyclase (GGDEF)-like protein